jgi:hypothetical protein
MKNMKTKLEWLKRHKKYFFFGVPAVLILLFIILGGGEKAVQTHEVKAENIEQSVKLSGSVRTTDNAELGFASSGRIARIYVKNNQAVRSGQVLAQLEIGDLVADLKIKQLNAKTSGVSLEDAKEEVEQVTKEENTKVESTYREMLSEDLELIANSNTYTVETPTVTGLYAGSEGQYKLNIQRSGPETKLFTYGLERSEIVINEEGPTKLGSKGLYISFPDEIQEYEGTIWYLDIPNKTSSAYPANFNERRDPKKYYLCAICRDRN